MRETEEEEGARWKKFHRCNASWHPKRHSWKGFGKNNHTCLYNLFKLSNYRRTMRSLLSFRHSWRQPLYYSRVWQLVGLLCIWMAYLREAWLSVAVACNVSNASLSAARGIYHRRCVCPHDRKQYAPSLTDWPGQYELNFLERLSTPIITKGWNIVCQRTRLALF